MGRDDGPDATRTIAFCRSCGAFEVLACDALFEPWVAAHECEAESEVSLAWVVDGSAFAEPSSSAGK